MVRLYWANSILLLCLQQASNILASSNTNNRHPPVGDRLPEAEPLIPAPVHDAFEGGEDQHPGAGPPQPLDEADSSVRYFVSILEPATVAAQDIELLRGVIPSSQPNGAGESSDDSDSDNSDSDDSDGDDSDGDDKVNQHIAFTTILNAAENSLRQHPTRRRDEYMYAVTPGAGSGLYTLRVAGPLKELEKVRDRGVTSWTATEQDAFQRGLAWQDLPRTNHPGAGTSSSSQNPSVDQNTEPVAGPSGCQQRVQQGVKRKHEEGGSADEIKETVVKKACQDTSGSRSRDCKNFVAKFVDEGWTGSSDDVRRVCSVADKEGESEQQQEEEESTVGQWHRFVAAVGEQFGLVEPVLTGYVNSGLRSLLSDHPDIYHLLQDSFPSLLAIMTELVDAGVRFSDCVPKKPPTRRRLSLRARAEKDVCHKVLAAMTKPADEAQPQESHDKTVPQKKPTEDSDSCTVRTPISVTVQLDDRSWAGTDYRVFLEMGKKGGYDGNPHFLLKESPDAGDKMTIEVDPKEAFDKDPLTLNDIKYLAVIVRKDNGHVGDDKLFISYITVTVKCDGTSFEQQYHQDVNEWTFSFFTNFKQSKWTKQKQELR